MFSVKHFALLIGEGVAQGVHSGGLSAQTFNQTELWHYVINSIQFGV